MPQIHSKFVPEKNPIPFILSITPTSTEEHTRPKTLEKSHNGGIGVKYYKLFLRSERGTAGEQVCCYCAFPQGWKADHRVHLVRRISSGNCMALQGKEICTKTKWPSATQLSQSFLLIPFGFKTIKKIYSKRIFKRERGGGINSSSLWHTLIARVSLSCNKYEKKLNWEPKWTKISTVPEENMSIAKGKERVYEWCNYSSQNINPYSPLEIFFNK